MKIAFQKEICGLQNGGETVQDASGKDQLSVLKPWSGYEVRWELFQCNSSTSNNPGSTYKVLIPFMKTPYFLQEELS